MRSWKGVVIDELGFSNLGLRRGKGVFQLGALFSFIMFPHLLLFFVLCRDTQCTECDFKFPILCSWTNWACTLLSYELFQTEVNMFIDILLL